MKVFISGGCKSGKSTYAEKTAISLAGGGGALIYAATMLPSDKEDEERIALHRKKRAGLGFETVEIPKDIKRLADMCPPGATVLIDSITALLANEMFQEGGGVNGNAGGKINSDLAELFLRVKNVVVVSDFIYSDGLVYGELTEKYREALAAVDRYCAKACDAAVEVFCGSVIIYKGEEALNEVFNKAD